MKIATVIAVLLLIGCAAAEKPHPQQAMIDKCIGQINRFYIDNSLANWQISSTKVREGCTWRVEDGQTGPWGINQNIRDWR